ncbi:MAG: sigma-54 dependent transcriptional regulator [Kangiellaceae bacterium]|jgi:DNA-binding NtrC family response regulator|nr:sigma-54 dependent transcriptional regulator [Kangiellaceae bacterium]
MLKKLLIVKSDDSKRKELSVHFSHSGWDVLTAASLASAEKVLKSSSYEPHVIIADVRLPDGDTLRLVSNADEDLDYSEWIFLADGLNTREFSTLDKLAFDIVESPFSTKSLSILASRAFRSATRERIVQAQEQKNRTKYRPESFLGSSRSLQELREMLVRLNQVPLNTVMIQGETGTGKGLVSKILHHGGIRKGGSFIEINCAALPRDLLESQLFGHEAGAFTGASKKHKGLFEQADGGTLFLDEIAEMELDLQAKLLKVIEDKKVRRLGATSETKVDVQIIAASGVDFGEMIQQGTFREDLFHRLTVFNISLPSLRQRKDDLIELVPAFIAELNAVANKKVTQIPDEIWQRFANYDWPGNVRELNNVLERCVLMSSGDKLPIEWLQLGLNDTAESPTSSNALRFPLDGSMSLDEFERNVIIKALELEQGNVSSAATVLGLTRETLRYRIKKFDIK